VMGTGKSTVARALAAVTEAIVIRTDVVRKRLGGVALTEHGRHAFDEGLYTEAMTERTYAEALRLARELLRAGWNVIVDGSFSRAIERDGARALARELNVPFRVLWCDAPDSRVVEHLRQRASDPREVSDGREQLLADHRRRYETPEREPDAVRLDTARDPSAAVTRAREALGA